MRHIALLLGSSIMVGTQLSFMGLPWLIEVQPLLSIGLGLFLSTLFLVGWTFLGHLIDSHGLAEIRGRGSFSIPAIAQNSKLLRYGCSQKWAIRSGVALVVAVWGSAYGYIWTQNALSHRLPADLDKLEVEMVATLERLEQRGSWQRLTLRIREVMPVDSSHAQAHSIAVERVQLNLYSNIRVKGLGSYSARLTDSGRFSTQSEKPVSEQNSTPALKKGLEVGDTLHITAKLRAFRNFSNGLSFDYEAHQLSKGIDARGYIRSIQVLEANRQSSSPVETFARQAESTRLGWISQIEQAVDPAAWLWISGLVFGEQDAFTANQWQAAQATGTLHLLVVSGLHLSAFATCGLLLVALTRRLCVLVGLFRSRLWNERRPERPEYLSPRGWLLITWGLVSALALFYVWLAGAGVALQRAWIMLFALLLVLVNARRLHPGSAICYAFAALLLVNPLVYTGAGFWFSMSAVGVLIVFLSGRRLKLSGALWLPQWVVFLGVLPVLLNWDQAVSLSHVIANTLAIPLMVMVVLPLTFVVLLLSQIQPDGGIFQMAESALAALGNLWWQGLHETAQVDWPSFSGLPVNVALAWVLMLAFLSLGVRPRLACLGFVLAFVVLFTVPANRPAMLGLLDVGQGLALVAVQNGQSLVYDTGPAYSQRFNAGSAILLPVLSKLGVEQIDALVVSHGDNDHAGGLGALLTGGIPVHQLWLGQPTRVSRASLAASASEWLEGSDALGDNCHRMSRSEKQRSAAWIDITDDIAYRFFPLRSLRSPADNDTSCVVQIHWFDQRVLIPGDIGRRRELELVGRYGDRLKSDVLIVAHHGSRSSSAEAFLTTVDPQQAWISAGFNNRFGHPAKPVTDRLNRLGIPWASTAEQGAIWLDAFGQTRFQRNAPGPLWRQP